MILLVYSLLPLSLLAADTASTATPKPENATKSGEFLNEAKRLRNAPRRNQMRANPDE